MKLNRLIWAPAAGVLMLAGCNLQDNNDLGDNVYTCNASTTVLEMCIEEAAKAENQSISKSTCQDVKGTWSESSKCPTSYKKKCKDGEKWNYYYAADDAEKPCADLVMDLSGADDRFAMSFRK